MIDRYKETNTKICILSTKNRWQSFAKILFRNCLDTVTMLATGPNFVNAVPWHTAQPIKVICYCIAMGIPKFFRWLRYAEQACIVCLISGLKLFSERYPLCSQLVNEHSVPEFDNFYLDMNGIIHNCSRSMTATGVPYNDALETEIFVAVFAYVQALFETIRPKKVMFLAIDGVAPRAKLNQQRSRRFRSVKEAQKEHQKRAERGEKGGSSFADRFDSNCITPGTRFMHRLGGHMRYLIAKRIEENAAWRNVQIIFSGPDVPGEGEHKIMEFIRLSKAKDDYNPNVRHCLYGLDADLILLGLLSHDPHFALLREEVQFGKQKLVKSANETRFYLLHLCLIREYFQLEFKDHDLEATLDDFILLMCFVGNDFLPSLPDFHLGEGVLEILFNSYKRALEKSDGKHLNENGHIVFSRLALLLEDLVEFEKSRLFIANPHLTEAYTDNAHRLRDLAGQFLDNFLLCDGIYSWTPKEKQLNSKERTWLYKQALRFNLYYKSPEGTQMVILEKNPSSKFVDPTSLEELTDELARLDQDCKRKLEKTWHDWKQNYYYGKMGFDISCEQESLNNLLRFYCEGLQWTMSYYYQGVSSWSWFFPYLYAPHISDLVEFCRSFVCSSFDFSAPLSPLEQLMAVLPPGSSQIVPPSLASLMNEGPTKVFYPKDFDTDSNGKKASWEALVKIPFIETKILLPEIRKRYHLLAEEERLRNKFGPTVTFIYIPGSTQYVVETPAHEYLPTLTKCSTTMIEYELPTLLSHEQVRAALCDGVRMGVHAMPGFPTLRNLPLSAVLDSSVGLHVFDQPSKGRTLVLCVGKGGSFGAETPIVKIADCIVGKRVYVNWPHLREAEVDYISDGCLDYKRNNSTGEIVTSEINDASAMDDFERAGQILENELRKRCAVLIGPTTAIAFVRLFSGMKMTPDGGMRKEFTNETIPYAVQLIVPEVTEADERYIERKAEKLQALYPPHTPVICVGEAFYGCRGTVASYEGETMINVKLHPRPIPTPSFPTRYAEEGRIREQWIPANELARRLGMSPTLLSKLASSMTLFFEDELVKPANIGLNIKSDAKGVMAWGLARRAGYWEYSPKVALALERITKEHGEFMKRLKEVVLADKIDGKALFPEAKTREELIAAVIPIQELICNSLGKFLLIPTGDYVSEATLKLITDGWRNYRASHPQLPAQQVMLQREEVISGATANARFRNHRQTFHLGQRVTLVTCSYFGSEGIVIGIEQRGKLKVMLDTMTIGAGSFDGMVEEGYGITVDVNECLNLNYIQPPKDLERSKDFLHSSGDRNRKKTANSNGNIDSMTSKGKTAETTRVIRSVVDRLKEAKSKTNSPNIKGSNISAIAPLVNRSSAAPALYQKDKSRLQNDHLNRQSREISVEELMAAASLDNNDGLAEPSFTGSKKNVRSINDNQTKTPNNVPSDDSSRSWTSLTGSAKQPQIKDQPSLDAVHYHTTPSSSANSKSNVEGVAGKLLKPSGVWRSRR